MSMRTAALNVPNACRRLASPVTAISLPPASPSAMAAATPRRRRLFAGQAQAGGTFAGPELQRQHAHADQVAAVDALVALGDHRPHAQQPRSLGRPVARRAGAVFLAGQHEQRHAFFLVLHRGVEDRHLLAVGQVPGDAALGAGRQLVLEARRWRRCRAPSPRGCRAASRRS